MPNCSRRARGRCGSGRLDFLQIITLQDGAFDISAGTRGFAVTEGNLFTVDHVCNEFQDGVRVQDRP